MMHPEKPGCLSALLRLLFGGSSGATGGLEAGSLPYSLRDDFMSPAELSFYHVLCQAVGSRASVMVKVGLGDVFFVSQPHKSLSYLNRISAKHTDFLICETGTLRPLVGVELDDRSHKRTDRQARDMFVDGVFAAVELPLVRVRAQAGYSVQEIGALLSPHLSGVMERSTPPVGVDLTAPLKTEAAPTLPTCPRCGVPMMRRRAGKGTHVGEEFYGCPNYPRCHQRLPV